MVLALVSFKGISQIDTKKNDSIVTLNQAIARKVVADLVRYDFAKQIIKEQELRIKNYQKKEIEFKDQLCIKDSIITIQKTIIGNHKEIINNKKAFEIHGYAGVQSVYFSTKQPIIYTNVMFEFTRFSVGAQYYVQPNNLPGYGIVLEYNLF